MKIIQKRYLKYYGVDPYDKKQFDIITCLFSSIGYVKNYTNLRKTIKCFSNHLKSGGIVIIEPFFDNKSFVNKTPHARFVDKPEIKLARINVSKKSGNTAILDFHFFIATKNGVEYFRDKNELGLFDIKKFLKIMEESGFRAKFIKNGLLPKRGLYVGVKI